MTLNVGTGVGYSVREVIDEITIVSGFNGEAIVKNRRPGDPSQILANIDLSSQLINWRAQLGLREMVESAWAAHTDS